MSEEMAISSGRGMRVDSSQPQQQEITIDNHRPHISVDQLLEVIKGANGMPVLIIPSSDGQLSGIVMNGVQNMLPSNHEGTSSTEKKIQDYRTWLLLITSLAASVTFTAGLTPPGGFWAADDKDNGYVAGTSVMHDKFPVRYTIFQYSNSLAFVSSLMIIGTLAIDIDNRKVAAFRDSYFPHLVSCCFVALLTSFGAGTWQKDKPNIAYSAIFGAIFGLYTSINMLVMGFISRRVNNS